VEEDDKAVTVVIAGIKTPYPRDIIKTIEFVKTVEEEYAEKRPKLQDDDITGRYALARWLYDKKAFPLAKKELDDLAKRDPKNAVVSLLKRIVDEKVKATPGTSPPGTTTPGTTTPGTTAPDAEPSNAT